MRNEKPSGLTAPTERSGAKRPALIVAVTLAVLCPHCQAEQPAPDNGSDCWLPAQITKAQGLRVCVSCDLGFRLNAVSRVSVSQ